MKFVAIAVEQNLVVNAARSLTSEWLLR